MKRSQFVFLIITYFKLRENQNRPEEELTNSEIITYFKLRENQNLGIIIKLIKVL